MKVEEKARCRELRTQGISIKQIAKEVGVATSSVSVWTRDIELTKEQVDILEQRNPIINRQLSGAKSRKSNALNKRLQYQQEGREMARKFASEPLFVSGCMLYWGEGSKSRNSVQFVNSDPNMMSLFWRFLIKYFDISLQRVGFSVQIYTANGVSEEDIGIYWLNLLPGLTSQNFRKFMVNKISTASQQKKVNVLPYGTARLSYSSTEYVQNIYGAIQELAEFQIDSDSKWLMSPG